MAEGNETSPVSSDAIPVGAVASPGELHPAITEMIEGAKIESPAIQPEIGEPPQPELPSRSQRRRLLPPSPSKPRDLRPNPKCRPPPRWSSQSPSVRRPRTFLREHATRVIAAKPAPKSPLKTAAPRETPASGKIPSARSLRGDLRLHRGRARIGGHRRPRAGAGDDDRPTRGCGRRSQSGAGFDRPAQCGCCGNAQQYRAYQPHERRAVRQARRALRQERSRAARSGREACQDHRGTRRSARRSVSPCCRSRLRLRQSRQTRRQATSPAPSRRALAPRRKRRRSSPRSSKTSCSAASMTAPPTSKAAWA